MKVSLTQQEIDTIIAALRHWQNHLEQESISHALMCIASENGDPLSVNEIDGLVEKIQFDQEV
jgi:hypothetical protein